MPVRHLTLVVALLFLMPGLAPAQKSKPADDSPIVAGTRKKLDRTVTVDFKDVRIEDALKEIADQAEVRFNFTLGVSRNTSITYTAKDKPLKDILHDMFKDKNLGYVIHRKANAADRYEGYLDIVPGDNRGDPDAPRKEPVKVDAKTRTPAKPAKPETKSAKPPEAGEGDATEKQAASRLKLARTLVEDGQTADAREALTQIMTRYPKTKAAKEARELLDKLKK